MPVLQDGESWNKAIRPKAAGAWNLHALSLDLPELQHFVMFSSIVSAIGHHGNRPHPSVSASLQSLCNQHSCLPVKNLQPFVLLCPSLRAAVDAVAASCRPTLPLTCAALSLFPMVLFCHQGCLETSYMRPLLTARHEPPRC